MKPRTREVIARAATRHGLDQNIIIGPQRRQIKEAVAARLDIITELWDRKTFGRRVNYNSHAWSVSEVARELGMDHTTIIHGLKRAGIYGSADHG